MLTAHDLTAQAIERVTTAYDRFRAEGYDHAEAVYITADEVRLSDETVRRVLAHVKGA